MLNTAYPYVTARQATCNYVSPGLDVVVESRKFYQQSGGIPIATIINSIETEGPFVTYLDGGTTLFQ
jgi:hypothetical protein